MSNGFPAFIIPEIPTAIMFVWWVPEPPLTPLAIMVSAVMFEAPTLPHHSSTTWLLPALVETLLAQLSEELSVTLVEGLLLSWLRKTMITSLLRQLVKTTLTVVAGD